MSSRAITSHDVASLPQPGFNLAESIRFSPDDTLLTYLRSPNQTLTRQLYAYNIKTEKEFVYAEPNFDDEQSQENLSMEEQLRREVCILFFQIFSREQTIKISFFFFLASTTINHWYNTLSMGEK
jgi:hypothetical protein